MSSCPCRATKNTGRQIARFLNGFARQALGTTILFLASDGLIAEDPPVVDGNQSISIDLDGTPLTITTTSRLAGAVHSIRWRNHEFIDSVDHGRQLQSACSFDAMCDEPFWAERFNPTEAGSRRDGVGQRTTSQLLAIQRDEREVRTSTKMAFWLAPGEKSEGRSALNTRVLSGHQLHKRIRLGAYDDPHVIQIDNTFELDSNQANRFAQFEVLTGYMPKEFSEFWKVTAPNGELHKLDDGPGEQPDPVILSTPDRQFAMGTISAGRPDWIDSQAGYGRFRFPSEQVVKWNVVYRYREIPSITKPKASFRVLVAVGTLAQVHSALRKAIDGKLVPLTRDGF
ncbi:MAG: hypothetical protein NTV29_06955 [Planctomycetota bacterium]|nr:hypothetical protein [Planctomycetota bacterium]